MTSATDQTNAPATDPRPSATEAPAETSTPTIAIPAAPLIAAITAAAAIAGGLGHAIAWGVKSTSSVMPQTHTAAAWLGAGAVWAAFIIGLAITRPWRRMAMTRFASMWLVGTGIRFLATLLLGLGLLYSAPRENRALIGLVLAGGYLAVLAAETAAVARALKHVRGHSSAGEIIQ